MDLHHVAEEPEETAAQPASRRSRTRTLGGAQPTDTRRRPSHGHSAATLGSAGRSMTGPLCW
jgi:hypothetical protein